MVDPDLSDEQLIALVAAGNEPALEILYDRYAPSVMGLAVRIIGERAAAEEVVQESFLRVWRHAATYQEQRGLFRSWLFSIAHRQAIDAVRRRSVRPQPAASDLAALALSLQADDRVNVAEAAGTEIRRQRVRQALAALPPEQLQVIELAYFRGLTRQEIAATTGAPLGTVHTRARLALQKLRAVLATRDVDV